MGIEIRSLKEKGGLSNQEKRKKENNVRNGLLKDRQQDRLMNLLEPISGAKDRKRGKTSITKSIYRHITKFGQLHTSSSTAHSNL